MFGFFVNRPEIICGQAIEMTFLTISLSFDQPNRLTLEEGREVAYLLFFEYNSKHTIETILAEIK